MQYCKTELVLNGNCINVISHVLLSSIPILLVCIFALISVGSHDSKCFSVHKL
jgi:hypothetical protein